MDYSGTRPPARRRATWPPQRPGDLHLLAGVAERQRQHAYYTRDPGGTLVSQRLPNGVVYHYLTDGQGSVVRLVDPSGNVVATYHYCPTGNPAVPPTGPAAAGNPYQQYGLLHDAATDSNWLGAIRIDPDSGNASQSAFCLILGGAFGFFCPRTSPAITGQRAQAQLQACPRSAANSTISEAVGTGRSRHLVEGFVQ